MSAEARRPDTAFWVEPAMVGGDRLRLDPGESHHLLHVHRAEAGAPFEAIDGAGTLYRCVLDSIEGGRASGRILERIAEAGELPVPIHLLVGLPPSGPVEAIVEHAVPMGAASIDFVAAERSGRPRLGEERLARLQRLARAGLKQSRRSRLPDLRSSPSLEGAASGLGPVLRPAARYLADPDGEPRIGSLHSGIQHCVALAVGPPGGFSARERSVLLDQGFVGISLGPSRLTTETAALTLLAIVRNSL